MATTSAPIMLFGMPPEVWSVLAIGAVGAASKWIFGLNAREHGDDERFDGKHLDAFEEDSSNPRLNDKVTEAILRHHRTQNR